MLHRDESKELGGLTRLLQILGLDQSELLPDQDSSLGHTRVWQAGAGPRAEGLGHLTRDSREGDRQLSSHQPVTVAVYAPPAPRPKMGTVHHEESVKWPLDDGT